MRREIFLVLLMMPLALAIFPSNIGYAEMTYVVTGDMKGATLEMRVPMDTEHQKVTQITRHELTPDDYGNYVTLQGKFRYEAAIRVDMRNVSIRSNPVMPINTAGYGDYLGSTGKITPHNPQITAQAKDISQGLSRELDIIAEVAEWAYENIDYDHEHEKNNRTRVSVAYKVLQDRVGLCGDYSVLAASMLRSLGIPVKYVEGWLYDGGKYELHAWLEAYVPGSGWIGVDATNGEVGFIDATHIKVREGPDPTLLADTIRYSGELPEYEKNAHVILTDARPFTGLVDMDFSVSPRITGPSSQVTATAKIESKIGTYAIPYVKLGFTEALDSADTLDILVLPPREKREVSFKLNVPELEGGYSYTYYINAMSQNATESDQFRAEPALAAGKVNDVKVTTLYKFVRNGEAVIGIKLANTGTVSIDEINATMALTYDSSSQLKALPLYVGEEKEMEYRMPLAGGQDSYIFRLDLEYSGKRQASTIFLEMPQISEEAEEAREIPIINIAITVLIIIVFAVGLIFITPYLAKYKKPFMSKISLHKVVKKKKKG